MSLLKELADRNNLRISPLARSAWPIHGEWFWFSVSFAFGAVLLLDELLDQFADGGKLAVGQWGQRAHD